MASLRRLVASGLISLALAGCGGGGSSGGGTSTATSAPSAGAAAAGTITVAGSTALLPLVKEAAGDYQAAHPSVKITVSGGGSATGITQVAAGAVTIGDSDIVATDQPGLEDHRVAVVAFAVAANPADGVKNLTVAQLRDVFAGKVANWKQVGGADQKVVVVNRPRSSGTRAVFAKTIMGDAQIAESGLTEDATGTAVSVVKQTPGAVTYAALSGLGASGLTVVSIGGVAPDETSVTTGKYPLWSYEHMYTKGAATGETARFIAYVSGAKELVRRNKFIAISAMKVTESGR